MASLLNDDNCSDLELDIEPYSFEPILQQSSNAENIEESNEEEEDDDLLESSVVNNWLVYNRKSYFTIFGN